MAPRPKPSWPAGAGKDPNEPFLRWLDRQFTDALGTSYSSLDARLDALGASVADHAADHIRGGDDEINGDLLDVDFTPSNYTRTTGSSGTTSVQELTSHLKGIDDALAGFTAAKTTTYSGKLQSPGTTASTTYYWAPYGPSHSTTAATAIVQAQYLWGRAGTIKNLRFINMDPLASPGTWSLTLNVNGSDESLTLTGLTTNVSTLQSDTTHSVTVAVGDKVCFKQVQDGSGNNTGSDPAWCFDFVET